MRLYLPARPPFSLSQVIHSHGWAQLAPFVAEADSGDLITVVELRQGPVVRLRIRPVQDGVSVTVDSDLSPDMQDEIRDTVTWMLGLDEDFAAFYEMAGQEPKLAHVEQAARGRILRSPSLFEDVVKTILTTNTAWSGTIRMNAALVERFGAPLQGDATGKAFPTARRLAGVDVERLRVEAKLGYRAPYVAELARSVASGGLELEALKHRALPTSEVRKRLLALKGVGDYATANLLMLLGRYDSIPVDSWAMKMVSQEWYGGQPVSRAEVEEAFERWGPYRGLAYWFWDWSFTG